MELTWLAPGLRLANPWALALLALVPFWYLALRRRRRVEPGLRLPSLSLLDELPSSWRARLHPLLDLMRLGAVLCLIIASARPQLGREREKVNQRGVDIMLALDVSGSMRAEDITPSRIEGAKRTIRQFIKKLTTDRVGLVVFAGRSFTQCPLTTDYGVLADLLSECQIGMVQFDGTAIGEALANCVYRFESDQTKRQERTGKQDDKERSRVVVLLTDGFNNTGRIQPLDAAKMAKLKHIRVHCIGLGTLEGAPVPWMQGGRRSYLQNPDGTLLITQLDEKSLRSIAQLTGGQYFRATDAAALDRVYQRIAAMEKHEIEIQKVTHHEERYLLPLLLALGLLACELLLGATWLRLDL